eukprot:s142_g6.t1
MSGSGSFEVVIAKVELPFGLVPRANRQQWQQATPKCEDDAEALHQDMDTGTEAEPAALAKGLKWVKRRKKPTGGQPTLAVETSYEGFASTLLARSGSAADQDHDVESGLSQDDQDACPVDAIDSGADDLPESARAEHAKVSAMSRLARSDVDPTSNPPPVETTETTLPPPRRVSGFRRELGIHRVERTPLVSRGPLARCYFCGAQVPAGSIRMQYQFNPAKIARWIHVECVPRIPSQAHAASLDFLRSIQCSEDVELQRAVDGSILALQSLQRP